MDSDINIIPIFFMGFVDDESGFKGEKLNYKNYKTLS